MGENDQHVDYGFVRERSGWMAGWRVVVPELYLRIKSDCGEDGEFEDVWRRFVNHLRYCGYDSMTMFQVSGVRLSKVMMDTLMPALNAKNIVSLAFFRTNFGTDGFAALAAYLESKSSLTKLEVTGSKIDDDVGARFFDAVAAHPSIEILKLEDCDIGNGIVMSSTLDETKRKRLNSTLAKAVGKLMDLDLRQNKIATDSIESICNMLATNPRLQSLNLRDNDISDDAAALLFSIAKSWRCKMLQHRHEPDQTRTECKLPKGR